MNLWSRDNIFSANQLWYHKKTMTSRENQQQENFLKLEKKKKKAYLCKYYWVMNMRKKYVPVGNLHLWSYSIPMVS